MTGWDDVFAPKEESMGLSFKRRATLQGHINASRRNLFENNPLYFCERLPVNRHWRIFPEFRESVAYVDIETTGLDMQESEITTIALYDGESVRCYVNGRNLDDFIRDIQSFSVLVTYNGKTFDVPFIERFFGTRLDHAHIDLRYVLKSLGYSGGLKRCEQALGIDRHELEGVDGWFAVLLWFDYLNGGNEKALETLLAYNIEDVVNLEQLCVAAYNMKIQETPFADSDLLPLPLRPEVHFIPDRETIYRIKRKFLDCPTARN